ARVEHVVDQDDDLAAHVEADPRLVDLGRLGTQTDVVAEEGDVEHASRPLGLLDPYDLGREPSGEVIAAVGDPHEDDVVGALVALDHLMGDPCQRPPHVIGAHDRGRHTATPPRACEEAKWLWPIRCSLPGLTGPALKGGSFPRRMHAGWR